MTSLPEWWPSENPWVIQDCIEGMAEMPACSVDLIIADYPFNCQDSRKDYVGFVKETAFLFHKILKTNGNLVVINNPPNLFKTASSYERFNLRNSIALIRRHAFRPAWHFGYRHNTAWLLTLGSAKEAKWNGTKVNHDKDFYTDVIQYQNGFISSAGNHPQAIPLSLVEMFIELLSDEGDVVFDPFLGSGGTLEACENLRRVGVGFEYHQKYEDMIEYRFKRGKKGRPLKEVFE